MGIALIWCCRKLRTILHWWESAETEILTRSSRCSLGNSFERQTKIWLNETLFRLGEEQRIVYLAVCLFVCLIHTPTRLIVGACGGYITSGSHPQAISRNLAGMTSPPSLDNNLSLIDTLSLDDLSLSNDFDSTLMSCPYTTFDSTVLLHHVRNDLSCLICRIHGVAVACGHVGGGHRVSLLPTVFHLCLSRVDFVVYFGFRVVSVLIQLACSK